MKLFQMKLAILFLVVVGPSMLFAQPHADITFTVNWGPADTAKVLHFGYDKAATYCKDAAFNELELAPPPPTGNLDARFIDDRGFNDLCMGQGLARDFRFWDTIPRVDTFKLALQAGESSQPGFAVSWPSSGLDAFYSVLTLKDPIGGFVTNINMLAQSSTTLNSAFGTYYIYGTELPNDVKIDQTGIPETFSLNQNYPNPFNPSTTISFSIEKAVYADIAVYDILGRKVRSLASEDLNAGFYSTQWNGMDEKGNPVSSGVYYVRMTARTNASSDQTVFSAVRKLMLTK